ncbi:dehydrogenase [Mycolicibacterium setense]|uniref:SDR family oxidoreductase n=1 Tax=Mycolicibacterium setense TaxID=431269 RepID=UPI0007E9F98E|nr:SDR family oxidoreductase [Mycolicibacterium setense]OBB17680.1 dehydrogenase [Mycolicibacterium setense]
MTASPEPPEIAIITGASTGIGAATAREFARRGLHVLAGVRRQQDADALRAPGIEPVVLDVTKADHIQALIARIRGDEQGRPVRILVNNAAVQVNVPIETFPIDKWRHMFEVNLFGQVAVTQALLPALIRDNGRVVNISSVGGKLAMATNGPYSCTKYAVEAFSDSLRRELAQSGVKVVVIEPGAVQTEMLGRGITAANELLSTMTPEQIDRYGGQVRAVLAQAEKSTRSGLPAEAAARVIVKASLARKPRTRYTVGRDAAMVTYMARFVPDRMLDHVLTAALRPYVRGDRKRPDGTSTAIR